MDCGEDQMDEDTVILYPAKPVIPAHRAAVSSICMEQIIVGYPHFVHVSVLQLSSKMWVNLSLVLRKVSQPTPAPRQ